jgi:tRNA-dihydrouridine synthase
VSLILAPLRGVTIRCFRRTFAPLLAAGGFDEAVTPFIPANAGVDPLKDRELRDDGRPDAPLRITPQFIGKDPAALRACLLRVRGAGYETADLNAGCPFPMVRKKGRGSGLLRTPEVLARLLEAGCETMGPGRFSLKVRLGVDSPDELLSLLPAINAFPLRFLTIHARTARQMYEGACDGARAAAAAAATPLCVVPNGDLPFPAAAPATRQMIGRGFVRWLGTREDCDRWLLRYVADSFEELRNDRAVLGRMKELIAYWKDLPSWRRRWPVLKMARSVEELKGCLNVDE